MAKRLFVGNLPYTASEPQLRELFAQAGDVDSVTIIIDRDTQRGKGFAFVEMNSDEDGQKAIEMFNGYMMDDRAMVVNAARPRSDQGERNYRGGGGGDRSGSRF
jgi:RNA recognition motif-containing protein